MTDLERVATRFGLDASTLRRLEMLAGVVEHDEQAPTALRAPDAILRDHVADSLVGLALPEIAAAERIADLGAGAGFPGLVLAIARPDATVYLIEANGRKCKFLERARAECGLENVHVIASRAELWEPGHGGVNVVTARALARLDVVCEYAAPLLGLGGSLVAWRGRLDPVETAAAARAAAALGLSVAAPLRVSPYRAARNRHLQVIRKDLPTPSNFPRRVGMAAKRPLGNARA